MKILAPTCIYACPCDCALTVSGVDWSIFSRSDWLVSIRIWRRIRCSDIAWKQHETRTQKHKLQ